MSDDTPAAQVLDGLGLEELKRRINEEHRAAQEASRARARHARAAGALLLEAKSRLLYGQWLRWLEACCGLAASAAQEYMRVARHGRGE